MILLQTDFNNNLAKILQEMMDYSGGRIAASFADIFTEMHQYAFGIAAAGLVAGMLIPVTQLIMTGNFGYDTFFKYLLMAGLFASFPSLVRFADDVFKEPGMRLEKRLAVQTQDGTKIVKAYVESYRTALDKKYEEDVKKAGTFDVGDKIAYAIDNAMGKMEINCWLFIAMIVNMMLDVVMFLMKFASIFGAELLIALSPLSFGISFFRGFEGSIVGVMRYIFVFRLWGAVATAIKFAAFKIGLFDEIYKFHAQIDAGYIPASPEWGPLVLQTCFIIVMFLTPMFADAIISGSQAGAFFNAAMAKGASMMSPIIKGGKSAGGKMYEGSGAKDMVDWGKGKVGTTQDVGYKMGKSGAKAVDVVKSLPTTLTRTKK